MFGNWSGIFKSIFLVFCQTFSSKVSESKKIIFRTPYRRLFLITHSIMFAVKLALILYRFVFKPPQQPVRNPDKSCDIWKNVSKMKCGLACNSF